MHLYPRLGACLRGERLFSVSADELFSRPISLPIRERAGDGATTDRDRDPSGRGVLAATRTPKISNRHHHYHHRHNHARPKLPIHQLSSAHHTHLVRLPQSRRARIVLPRTINTVVLRNWLLTAYFRIITIHTPAMLAHRLIPRTAVRSSFRSQTSYVAQDP